MQEGLYQDVKTNATGALCHSGAVSREVGEDKLWSFPTPFPHPEAIVSNGTQRQIIVIVRHAIQARSCPRGRRDKLWSFYALCQPRGMNLTVSG